MARFWARWSELILPIGFFLLLLSTVPQFTADMLLVNRLDGDPSVMLTSIFVRSGACYRLWSDFYWSKNRNSSHT